jgi:predicted DNA-binding transcriptional regulator AlpA
MPSNSPATETILPELLTLRQAADLCAVSERTLWTWARSGASPAPLKIHKGIVRYSRAAYVAWIAGGCKPIQGGPCRE